MNEQHHTPQLFVRLLLTGAVCLLLVSCKENTLEPSLTGSISGTVLSAADNLPLANVLVTTNPPTESVMTAVDGSFAFTDLDEGTYVVNAERDGFDKGHVSVTVRGAKSVAAVIMMTVESSTSTVAPPRILRPVNNAVETTRAVELAWSRGAGSLRDSVYYSVTVYDGSTSAPVFTATGLRDTVTVVEGLRFGTAYFWQILASNAEGDAANSDVWSFRVADIPDNRIVYSALADGNPDIFSADTTGANIVRLTEHPARDLWPRWNRDRSKIAFISDRDGAYHIYTMRRDGSDVRRITTLPVAGYQNQGCGFCWAPDGGWLFYGHYDKLYRVDQFGSNLALISTAPAGRHFREIAWSWQYDRILAHVVGALPYESEIMLLRPDGSLEKTMVGDMPGCLGAPSFTIDGKTVLYTRDVSGYQFDDGRQLDSRIHLMSLDQKDTLDISSLKQDGTNDSDPCISPDGASVVFTNASNDGSREGEIWLMRRDGSHRRRLLPAGMQADWK